MLIIVECCKLRVFRISNITLKGAKSMPKQDNSFNIYYDGSSNLEFSEEIVKGLDEKQNEVIVNKDEWRRFISANPFGPLKILKAR